MSGSRSSPGKYSAEQETEAGKRVAAALRRQGLLAVGQDLGRLETIELDGEDQEMLAANLVRKCGIEMGPNAPIGYRSAKGFGGRSGTPRTISVEEITAYVTRKMYGDKTVNGGRDDQTRAKNS